jgi:hypothetical protein
MLSLGMTKTKKPSRREGHIFRTRPASPRGVWHAQKVCEDLEQLRVLRDYLIFRRKVLMPYDDLTKAIDDYVEKLTGDRRTLHGQNHSIG